MMQSPPFLRSRGPLLRLGAYLLIVAATIVWEARTQVAWTTDACDLPAADATPPFYAPLYSFFLNWAGKEGYSDVRVIAIETGLENIQQNTCRARGYLADLLQTVAAQHPSVIVVDKFFGPGTCAAEPASTERLLGVVRSLPMPVVIGENTDDAPREMGGSCLVQRPQLEFGAANVRRGLTRLNVNREQIALQWPVLPAVNAAAAPRRDALAFAAAKLALPDAAAQERFQKLLTAERQPYARIGAVLRQQTSTDLLCSAGTAAARKSWALDCSHGAETMDLAGKVVVIGAENAADDQVVLGRHRWGFQLQALYIDALLSGNYLRMTAGWVEFAAFALFLVMVEAVPTLAEVVCPKRDWRVPALLGRDRRLLWALLWWGVFSGLLILVPLGMHFLPPLLLLFDIAAAMLAYGVVALSAFGTRLVIPEKKEVAP